MTMKQRDGILEFEEKRENNSFLFWSYEMPYTGENKELVPPHWHDYLEIVYTETNGILYINDKSYSMENGDIFFVNPGCIHRSFRESRGLMAHIVFDLKLLLPLGVNDEWNSLVNSLIGKTKRFPEKPDRDSKLYKDLLPDVMKLVSIREKKLALGYEGYSVISTLWSILASCALANSFRTVSDIDIYGMEYVASAMQYIEKHYGENIKVDDVAAASNISPTYLYRLFRDYVGASPVNYINSIRLRAAYRLLESGMSVTETAATVGIPNTSYFIKLFKTATGQTPKNYLKQRNKSN